MEKYTLQEVFAKIEWEGFHCFFGDYASPDRMPEEIRESVQKFRDASEELHHELLRLGWEY